MVRERTRLHRTSRVAIAVQTESRALPVRLDIELRTEGRGLTTEDIAREIAGLPKRISIEKTADPQSRRASYLEGMLTAYRRKLNTNPRVEAPSMDNKEIRTELESILITLHSIDESTDSQRLRASNLTGQATAYKRILGVMEVPKEKDQSTPFAAVARS